MADFDKDAWETSLIADLRANGGRPSQGPLAGQPILLLYTIGAKSGEERRSILTYSRDGDAYVVAGSNSGAPTNSHWVSNIAKSPAVRVEVDTVEHHGTATVADEAERERLWASHVAQLPWFADYPAQAGRTIPMVRITLDD